MGVAGLLTEECKVVEPEVDVKEAARACEPSSPP